MTQERRSRRLTIVVTLLLVIGALVVVADSTLGLRPAACAACHIELARTQAAGPHAGASCLSCHLEAGTWSVPGFKWQQWTVMYPRQLVGAPPRPARDISRAACLSCHEDVEELGLLVQRGLRIVHSACAESPARCTACHGETSHGQAVRWGQQVEMDECTACHVQRNVTIICDACHVGRLETERLRRGPWRVTHGPEWPSTHAMGEYDTCTVCHESGFCERCHDVPVPHPRAFGSTHGSYARDGRAACESCHRTANFCDGCHNIEMPHPAGFLQAHTEVADGLTDPVCITCHEMKGCTRCHERHDAHPDEVEMQLFRMRR